MTALDAAFPFDESDGIARIEQDLDFHVPCPSEVFLEEEVWVPEVRERDAASRLKRRREFGRSVDPRHPDPSAARGRLEEHWIAEFRRDDACLVKRPEGSVHAAGNRNAFPGHRLPCGDLVTREGHRIVGRADEDQSRLRASLRKSWILRE